MKTIVENLGRHLRERGLRLTQERIQLLTLIASLKGHFNAEELLDRIKARKIPVSRATVYRILPVLVNAGLIQQSLLSEGQARFEVTWNRDHHDHLICSSCNRVVEFQHSTIEILQKEIANKYGFVLEHHVMELVGRCFQCRASAN